MSALEPLGPQQIHLWFAHMADAQARPELAAAHQALLSEEERRQQSRFLFEKDQRRHLLTRALVRSVLSRYSPVEPAAWRFEANAHGRPALANPDAFAQQLNFNLSHTSDLIVLAVSRGREVGVDVESTERNAPLAVADRFFSAPESTALRALPHAAQPWRFWELWTLKESYIKARGMGLAIPLHRFSFVLPLGGEHIGLSFAEGFDDRAERWAFWQFQAGAHLVSVCAQALPGDAPRFTCRRLVPLEADAHIELPLLRRSGATR